MFSDTIVALCTGQPPSAVAWVRLSGPDAYEIAGGVFMGWPLEPVPRMAIYGQYLHGDDGIALPFPEGHSYTGEQTVELSVHGSRASISRLIQACEAAGARQAGPGEFTMRAFLNGRIDLTQAEAVAETVEAATERQLRAAELNRMGALAGAVGFLRERLLGALAGIEATIDFSEEIGELDFEQVAQELSEIAGQLTELMSNGRSAHLARLGRRIALVGRPNVGKSSLLNALLGLPRAIVSDIPGTTRDTVEESADFGGVKVVLVDTAGIRETADPVEQMGVSRTLASAGSADEIWYVYDASVGWTHEDASAVALLGREVVVLANKSDLRTPSVGLAVSALTGQGLSDLIGGVASGSDQAVEAPPVNDRQEAALRLALESIQAAVGACEANHPPDLLSVLVTEAIVYLGRVTGETASPNMLQEIFARFCIGK